MTAQRLVRGSKARIIASLCAVVFFVGLLVLFQRSQTELDNANKNYKICFEQQEGLATQLKVIVDYKTRLEKSLQAEKAEHKQTRTELESRINDEKTKRDKTSKEANNRFQSLQQHYKLLQTKHDDLQEKYDKLQQQKLEEIEKLELKIKEFQEQIKQSKVEKDKTIETLKSQHIHLTLEKDKLKEELKKSEADHEKWENDVNHLTKLNHQLKRELEASKNKDNYKNFGTNPEETIIAPQQTGDVDNHLLTVTTTRKFAKQIEVATDIYEIRDNNGKSLGQQESNIPQIDTPNNKGGDNYEQQNAPNVVLQKPSSSSSRSTTKSNAMVSQANLNNAHPLLLPTVTPSNANRNTSKFERSADFNLNSINVLPMPNNILPPHKKLPPGVVPVPVQELQKHDDSQPKNDKTEDKNNGIAEEINLALPNRYRNNIIESELANEINKEIKPEVKPANSNNNNNNINHVHNEPEMNMGGDMNQQDNAAEVIDQPRNPIQDDLMDVNMNAGAAAQEVNDDKFHEFKQSFKDPVVQLLENKKMKKQHIDTLLRNVNGENGAIRAPPGGAMYENEGDYDKDGQKEDLQIEEADPEGEEDDDVDDYDGHMAARQKEPAVRN